MIQTSNRLVERMNLKMNLITKYSHKTLLITLSLAIVCVLISELASGDTASPPQTTVISSRAAFLRAQRASRQSQQQAAPPASSNKTTASIQSPSSATNNSSSIGPIATSTTLTSQPATSSSSSTSKPNLPLPPSGGGSSIKPKETPEPNSVTPKQLNTNNNNNNSNLPTLQQNSPQQQHSNNRSTRTADVFQNGDGFNIFVTNTCDREQMHVNIRTSRPFHGVIHTRNQRQKSVCTVEGTGDTEYNMDISHVLNSQDANYCGVIKARRGSPDDKDLLSVVIAVRVHRNIELSDDKFFLLNCTNRCRRPDCSNPSSSGGGSSSSANNNNKLLLSPNSADTTNARVIGDEIPDTSNSAADRERESVTPSAGSRPGAGGEPESQPDPDKSKANANTNANNNDDDECTIWKFPWLITLLWCMGILLLAMIISHCIMCSSVVCKCVKTEVEEREPSVYEDDDETDDEDNLYNKKNHPMRIDYDNRDIYKTSNNYEPYNLSEVQQQQHSNSRARKGARGQKSRSTYEER